MIGAGTVLLFLTAVGAGAESDPPLPKGTGRSQVAETCTPCHSAALILQNRMSRQRWDETITGMQEKQGLGELTPGIRNQILDYLESVQGLTLPAEESQPRTRRMYEYDYSPNPL